MNAVGKELMGYVDTVIDVVDSLESKSLRIDFILNEIHTFREAVWDSNILYKSFVLSIIQKLKDKEYYDHDYYVSILMMQNQATQEKRTK